MYEIIVIIMFYDNKFCAVVFLRFLPAFWKDRHCISSGVLSIQNKVFLVWEYLLHFDWAD